MEIKTFRAKSMQLALDLVRHELGSEATVLHTREVNGGLVRRLLLGRYYEIAATGKVQVPSRLPQPQPQSQPQALQRAGHRRVVSAGEEPDFSARYRDTLRQQDRWEPNESDRQPASGGMEELQSLVEQLQNRPESSPQHDLPAALFPAFTDMIEADVDEEVARELIERLRRQSRDLSDPLSVQSQLVRMLEDELSVTGPIDAATRPGRTVALVGPTGVGKTTTIAKLAANFRLRENKRVGLITVDTYRIAAVEQLRTYADIIDLPMEVVSTPREMREAVDRLSDLDLVLMDTAGRSPRDEVRIQELKSMLAEAAPDEVHLVLSAGGSARSLATTAERFATVGTTALVVTKLDEATGLGSLLSLARSCQLPISYLTDGQNVPDDIQVAQCRALAKMILGIQE